MPRKCAHYDPVYCPDPASRMCHYVQNTISAAVAVRATLAPLGEARLLLDYRATNRYLAEIEEFLRVVGYDGD
jgi:hypothetical protein